MSSSDYYVYVYVDPRNFEEFYYGKGKGSRKNSHLKDSSDSAKAKRIKDIIEAGERPIIRVIAKGLTESEALLVEKTLLWKLGKFATNVATGHFAEKFRPLNSMHKLLPGFDFDFGIYFCNVGDGGDGGRVWEDSLKYGFVAAGQDRHWSDQLRRLQIGDVIAAYLTGHGYVGIGRVLEPARMVRDVKIRGRAISNLPIKGTLMTKHLDDPHRSDYVCLVAWIAAFTRAEAKWQARTGLFTTQLVTASLDNQPKTVSFLEREFKVEFNKLFK